MSYFYALCHYNTIKTPKEINLIKFTFDKKVYFDLPKPESVANHASISKSPNLSNFSKKAIFGFIE